MSDAVYLDHAATSWPKAPGVAEAMARFLAESAGNPGRGGHRLTVAASRAVESARESVAELLGGHPERTLLGPGATFWINTVLAGTLRQGDRVVISALEHNAVMRPLRRLERTRGIEVAAVEGADSGGVPSPDEVAAAVSAKVTRLVVMTHASNVTGAVLPVAEIAARVAPVPVLVDGAQTAGSIPVDFADLGAAAFACSGHKGLLGPPGVGVLMVRRDFDVPPLVSGGTGSASEHEIMPEALPDRLEAGTPNTVGIVGLGAACAWLAKEGVESIAEHSEELLRLTATELAARPGVTLQGYDPSADRVGVLSFKIAGLDSADLATVLDRGQDIMVRAGLHCAPAAHRRLGTFPEGTVRVGLGPFNSSAHLQRLIAAVESTLITRSTL